VINNSSFECNDINLTTDFVSTGILDSFAVLSLIMSLESEFSIKFQTEELADKSIRFINSLTELVVAKMQHSSNTGQPDI